MSTKLRLQRTGKKNSPFYRVIATDSTTAAKGGNLIEILGTYNPLKNPSVLEVNKEKVLSWIAKGAILSFRLRKLFGDNGILPSLDVSKLKKKAPKSKKTAPAPTGGQEEKEVAKPKETTS